jgi:hypothetical protein
MRFRTNADCFRAVAHAIPYQCRLLSCRSACASVPMQNVFWGDVTRPGCQRRPGRRGLFGSFLGDRRRAVVRGGTHVFDWQFALVFLSEIALTNMSCGPFRFPGCVRHRIFPARLCSLWHGLCFVRYALGKSQTKMNPTDAPPNADQGQRMQTLRRRRQTIALSGQPHPFPLAL